MMVDGRMFMSYFLYVLHVVPFNTFIQHVLDFKLILGISFFKLFHICDVAYYHSSVPKLQSSTSKII